MPFRIVAPITEAIPGGQPFPAPNHVNPSHSATCFVHPPTGRSVVVDDVTRKVIPVGGDGFLCERLDGRYPCVSNRIRGGESTAPVFPHDHAQMDSRGKRGTGSLV